MLVTGPSGRYYLVESDADEGEDSISDPNVIQHKEPYFISVDIETDCESDEEEEDDNEPVPSDYDSEELKNKEVNEKLDRFLVLEKVMSFNNLDEAKRVVSFYSVSNKKGLDTTRVRYRCDVDCPFVCLIYEDKKDQGFKIKPLEIKHTYQPTFKNKRATQQALAHYFKNKVQNNPKYKVKDMRHDLDDQFSLNISASKMKRVKRLVLEKFEGSFIDDFNRLKAYTQELRNSNPDTDLVINISKEALEQEYVVPHMRRNSSLFVQFIGCSSEEYATAFDILRCCILIAFLPFLPTFLFRVLEATFGVCDATFSFAF
ncbi:hypothetical protein RND71_019352 [Anisodus tanguticus]|uniref:Transposase MuDR plant domain-containing protein n=1 Tax=Anisodus tanguticus TaxID=243964 RepID=A0AAE1VHC0_9SOLA|nr:hypothetical protein RND71_019352 [Anisodus tanguticus]